MRLASWAYAKRRHRSLPKAVAKRPARNSGAVRLDGGRCPARNIGSEWLSWTVRFSNPVPLQRIASLGTIDSHTGPESTSAEQNLTEELQPESPLPSLSRAGLDVAHRRALENAPRNAWIVSASWSGEPAHAIVGEHVLSLNCIRQIVAATVCVFQCSWMLFQSDRGRPGALTLILRTRLSDCIRRPRTHTAHPN